MTTTMSGASESNRRYHFPVRDSCEAELLGGVLPNDNQRSWRRYAASASRSSCFRSTGCIPPLVILLSGA